MFWEWLRVRVGETVRLIICNHCYIVIICWMSFLFLKLNLLQEKLLRSWDVYIALCIHSSSFFASFLEFLVTWLINQLAFPQIFHEIAHKLFLWDELENCQTFTFLPAIFFLLAKITFVFLVQSNLFLNFVHKLQAYFFEIVFFLIFLEICTHNQQNIQSLIELAHSVTRNTKD